MGAIGYQRNKPDYDEKRVNTMKEKLEPLLIEPYVFKNVKNLPNFIGYVKELDLTGECFVEFASNVGHIKPFKIRMPLGWCNKIKPISALPNKANSSE